MVKVFGVGNVLLCDDGIGVRVAEKLKEQLENLDKESKEIKVILGETDYMYCLECIDDNDFVIIIDSTCFMVRPGIVTTLKLEECDNIIFGNFKDNKSAHEESLLKVLRSERKNIKGCLIGIEVDKISYSLELSKRISKRFELICENVQKEIVKLIRE